MQISIQGKQISIGDALKTHIEDKITDILEKYFNRATDVSVTISREAQSFFKAQIRIHVGRDITVTAHDEETEVYAAFDIAAAKVAKQLRRYKTRLRDHHERVDSNPEIENVKARDYVLSTQSHVEQVESQAQIEHESLIIAETTKHIEKLTVPDALMRLDLNGDSVLVFENVNHGGINVLYRRPDGNIGWIDPKGEETSLNRKAA
jgi:ribosomal subunit interface protein